MSTTDSNSTYWRRKLDAFLHDNPGKALDIPNHELRALALRLKEQLDEQEYYDKEADFQASAADRLSFPHAGKLVAPFDARENPFHHPLDGSLSYRSDQRLTADLIDEISQGNRTHLDESDVRTDFIARWRFWRQWAPEHAPALAFFPADTRIPDHTIWNHMGLTSAFQGCLDRDPQNRPALLLFSIGPVQPLIEAARRIGDLWSGSYLLSYLASTALGAIAKTFGPDHVLFPSVWGQPLIDLQLRDIYQQGRVRSDQKETLWNQLWRDQGRSRQHFLLPSLPNRFLALLPASEAESFARHLESTVRQALLDIGKSVSDTLAPLKHADLGPGAFHPERLRPQLEATLEIAWRTLPLPVTIEEAESWGKDHLPDNANGGPHASLAALDRLRRMWSSIPNGHHTGYGMTNSATAWPVIFSLLSWALDAAKNTRLFDAWGEVPRWEFGKDREKDQLTGKEEIVLMVPEDAEAARDLSKCLGDDNPNLLRANERLGALTLVKRFWHLAYLQPTYGFRKEDFRMPDTHQLAKGLPFSTESGKDADDEGPGYIAALALDGDEMGKWISGEKTPPLRSQLHPKAVKYFEENLPADGSITAGEFLDAPRPLNPSFHLQFSEALANFGLYAASRIVEAHNGRLIYAGGDDVLALLPADQALACAADLRAAFRGEGDRLASLTRYWNAHDGTPVDGKKLFATSQRGFLRLHEDLAQGGALAGEPLKYDVIVPGPRADVSAGIAIGHARSPLQDLVRSARLAEKRAKADYRRGAVAVSIFKRSGEQVHWGAKWAADSGDAASGLTFLEQLLRHQEALKGRFAYKLMELLQVYLGNPDLHFADRTADCDPAFAENASAIVERELAHCLDRAGAKALIPGFTETFQAYWRGLDHRFESDPKDPSPPPPPSPQAIALDKLRDFFRLLQAYAWLARAEPTLPAHPSPPTTPPLP
ncbi:MAG: type III-B CRISPR-associated protein Cas10/Cmr2, partial [Puniceicoccaceae bacterium]